MSDENDQTASSTPTLTRAKMLPVEGVVYCLIHDAVHDDTTDPYDTGEVECTKDEHRPVYYRARKGDIDESKTLTIEMVGEEQHGEVVGSIGLPEGALVIDRLTDVQERVKKRVIASRSDPLTDNEAGMLAGLVRVQIRKVERNKTGARKLFGDEYDPARHDDRLELLEGMYRKLGGDPERLSNRGEDQ